MATARWLTVCVSALLISITSSALAQTQKLRVQASFPPSSVVMENFKLWSDRVNVMSGGRLEIEGLAAGTVVPAFEVLDAVHKQVVEGGYSAAAYWVGKHRAAALFGPAPGGPWGMDEIDFLGWLYTGGGLALYQELYEKELKRNVVVIPMTFVGNQVFGWFAKPVKNWEDLKGRKCRQTGINAEVFAKAGMGVVNMPGGEIVPAAERGVIECAEWSSPADDMKIGFHSVWKHYYMPSVHEPAPILEVLINADVWKKLTPDLQQILKTAAWEATVMQRLLFNKLNVEALEELRTKHGVQTHRTPDDILKKILETWDQIAKEEEAKSPFFKKVYESQRAYASKVVPMRISTYPDYNFAAKHYWNN
ncbi:MAG: TRAP transporter substrate-binding protein [Hyphomicrobiaceae bacterium]|jgi:TRAP-type mannitol/chloroaromatic compound transport system substrate-binding protein